METIPLKELNHHTAEVTRKVRQGIPVTVTEHGRPVIRMLPAEEAVSALDRLAADGKLRRSAHVGVMPELIEELGGLPSLSGLLGEDRDSEFDR